MGDQDNSKFICMIAATAYFFCYTLLSTTGIAIVAYIAFFTKYWYIVVAYLTWIWVIDIETSETGGRTINWMRGLKWFDYARDYYPVTLTSVPGFKLDRKRNYMFCSFPHGVMPIGMSLALSTKTCNIDKLVPNHTIHPLTLHQNFKIPIYRDFMLSQGICSVTPKSINWILNHPDGGKVALILVGGAAEAAYSNPGCYTLVLKNRKGFIKFALRNGSPLVPVFSFGEVDSFKQLSSSENPLLRSFQEWFKQKTRISPLLFTGRGYYQKYVGLVPFSKPINVVVGKPIDVEKKTNPSQEDIDTLHQTFITKIIELFEEYKHKFIENADSTTLTIV